MASGKCMDAHDCTGFSTPGFCPGENNVQCCTSAQPIIQFQKVEVHVHYDPPPVQSSQPIQLPNQVINEQPKLIKRPIVRNYLRNYL
jgi:hypothetical protein